MDPLLLVLLLTLASPSESLPVPAGCQEDHGTCREDCTIEYGGSTKKYRQLGECLQRCDQARSACSQRYHSLQGTQLQLPPERPPEPRPAESESPPPPRPAPEPTAYEPPPLPPEPKKDLSEWDPEGD